jgi:hypothetical protein
MRRRGLIERMGNVCEVLGRFGIGTDGRFWGVDNGTVEGLGGLDNGTVGGLRGLDNGTDGRFGSDPV